MDSAAPRYILGSGKDSSVSTLAWSRESVLSMLPRRRPLERDLEASRQGMLHQAS